MIRKLYTPTIKLHRYLLKVHTSTEKKWKTFNTTPSPQQLEKKNVRKIGEIEANDKIYLHYPSFP